ncbi:squalene--hopene cyclase [Hazenella sp. IB182353]|uniref:prenyltransferase/squalene oxidase repeat-containing protein n=1 Tax=Polycladospora coralii TaxID=2771432 RepID=UPI001745C8D0|nr:prenyltransferase/squalene oxidase repeat-containing protein [Polycladospora coralii]MBS7529574.1 squalene--hopene cyclase [Polycladospora coralii]
MTSIHKHVQATMDELVNWLVKNQTANGSWDLCFETGVKTDALTLILLRSFNIKRPNVEQEIGDRLLHRRTKEGTWKLFSDEREGNLSETIEATLALLYIGKMNMDDRLLQKTREFIISQGGPREAGGLTRVLLTLLGHGSWSDFPKIPVEFFLLPLQSPVHFFDFVGYTRVHTAPIMIAADQKYCVELDGMWEINDWLPYTKALFKPDPHIRFWTKKEIERALGSDFKRFSIHGRSLKWGERFMLNRIESDGTLYNYLTSTFLMIYGLRALKYDATHPVIEKAIQGILNMAYPMQTGMHIQETTANVWNTSLILYAIQTAGLPAHHICVQKGLRYLNEKQHTKKGDWSINNPYAPPGGWGFSDCNTINPDVDDTSACLRAFAPSVSQGEYQETWNRGLSWLQSMQNQDGGWPAFEKNMNKSWHQLLPFKEGKYVYGDPSTADLTGRTLEFMGTTLGWGRERPEVEKGYQWLKQNQLTSGAWSGRWGIAYIYGTWAALTGLAAIRVSKQEEMVQKAVKWLYQIQLSDGGWGESCYSDLKEAYVPLKNSTTVQTAWALDALIAYHSTPNDVIRRGIERLLFLVHEKKEAETYPVGAGLAGQMYIYYHSYPYIFPLLTFARYQRKYSSSGGG